MTLAGSVFFIVFNTPSFGSEKMDHSQHPQATDQSYAEQMESETGAKSENKEKDRKIVVGRMKVTLMPEYDSTAVLVIQEGKFADRTAFPREINFILPKEVLKLTDVCSLSPGGHHFCQLFGIERGKLKNYLNIKLPFSDFFIDYQYAPFTVKQNSQREFTFAVDTKYDINVLEVHVQKPFRVEKFSISPSVMETYKKNGFEYYKYNYRNVKAGEAKTVTVSYFKTDARPSVDMKYSAMISPGVFKGNTGEILLAVGVAALGIIWFLRRRKRMVKDI